MKRREPILSIIFQIAGWILVALAGLGALGSMMDRQVGAVALLIFTGSFLFAAALFFGAAQVITALVETAENTRQIAERANETNRALQWLVDRGQKTDDPPRRVNSGQRSEI